MEKDIEWVYDDHKSRWEYSNSVDGYAGKIYEYCGRWHWEVYE